jgi:hypothetical protein
LSEWKLYCIHWIFSVKVEVMLYCRWGCFLNQCRVVVRVKEFVRVKVIVRVEVIPYRLGFPLSESKLYWTFQYSVSVIGSIM